VGNQAKDDPLKSSRLLMDRKSQGLKPCIYDDDDDKMDVWMELRTKNCNPTYWEGRQE